MFTVKFYKGPWHGKTRQVSAQCIEHGVIQVTVFGRSPLKDYYDNINPNAVVPNRAAIYKMRMVRLTLPNGKSWQGPAMHPDGSIYFVYEGTT